MFLTFLNVSIQPCNALQLKVTPIPTTTEAQMLIFRLCIAKPTQGGLLNVKDSFTPLSQSANQRIVTVLLLNNNNPRCL